MALKQLGIDIYGREGSVFFQASQENRVRLATDIFSDFNNRKLLKEEIIQRFIYKPVSLTFLSAYYINDTRIREKLGLGKVLSISNWKEKVISDDEERLIYGTISNLDNTQVLSIIYGVLAEKIASPLTFHNDESIVYVSSDVLDVVTVDDVKVKKFKNKYPDLYDKYYED
ncbi:hypothetical protein CHH91_04280 [Virgibacillus sp. 7505]|uniref:hypothetical protein n=1 Tax=Virgibacillus sp. 7505 TaxID=2022548 RepID=UPI000BA69EA1|nr:hypothetical protein [Virgibacillus sp. 7505]PAE17365.1 hypothetical protein CHH91_04280 [Virgibacillus sp. 7505]